MMLNKRLKRFLSEATKTDLYWVEKAKLAFAVALERQRKSSGQTNSQLAETLGTSPAYISKVFKGDTNFTIETMVKLARATGGHLEIGVTDGRVPASSWVPRYASQLGQGRNTRIPAYAAISVCTQVPTTSANNEFFGNDRRRQLEAA